MMIENEVKIIHRRREPCVALNTVTKISSDDQLKTRNKLIQQPKKVQFFILRASRKTLPRELSPQPPSKIASPTLIARSRSPRIAKGKFLMCNVSKSPEKTKDDSIKRNHLHFPCINVLEDDCLSETLRITSESGDLKKLFDLFEISGLKKQLLVLKCSEDGRTGFHFAAENGHKKAVSFFLSQGNCVDVTTINKQTALHLASSQGHSSVCKVLLKAGAKINLQDFAGNTALHIATINKHEAVIKLLLLLKADIRIQNSEGKTAIDYVKGKAIISIFWKFLSKNQELPLMMKQHSEDNLKNGKINILPAKESQRNLSDPIEISSKVQLPSLKIMTGLHHKEKHLVRETSEKLGLEDFIPICKLGQGSFGKVFLVNGKKDNKLYAMKAISKETVKSRKLEKYVYAEKSIHAIMHHPFIVPLHCCFQSSDRLFLVLEYHQSHSLDHVFYKDPETGEKSFKKSTH